VRSTLGQLQQQATTERIDMHFHHIAWARARHTRSAIASLIAAASLSLGAVAITTGVAHAAACPAQAVNGIITPSPTDGVNWVGCSFFSADLTNLTFTHALLATDNFTQAIVTGTNFTGADLWKANLYNAHTSGAGPNFTNANLALATGFGFRAPNSTFTGADLDHASFAVSTLTGSDFTDANLNHATLGPELSSATFDGAILTNAGFFASDLTGASFKGANIQGASFYSANLTGADFTGAIGTANFGDSTFGNATCPDGKLASVHYSNSCLKPVDNVKPVVAFTAPKTPFTIAVAGGLPKVSATWTVTDLNTISSDQIRFDGAPSHGGTPFDWVPYFANKTYTLLYPTEGYHYCFETRVADAAGNDTGWGAPRCVDTPTDDRNAVVKYSAHWTKSAAAGWLGSTKSATRTLNSTVTVAGAAKYRRVGLVATTCRTCGTVAVYIGAKKVGTINLHSATTVARTAVTLPRFAAGKTGVLKFVVTSTGKPVTIDGVLATTF
jgi:uncharacterized protein YjbI with pentapeptide repeats